jgi:hypothetical protein
MTIEEGQASIDQIDVKKQVVAESSRQGDRARSAQPRARRCGICGVVGHNSRTCKVGMGASGQEFSS